MDAAVALYGSIVGLKGIQDLVSNGVQESIYLEFKRKQKHAKPDLDPRDAEHFSRALSGFANSDGGVLVWGVGTGAGEKADSFHPITGILAFERSLKSSLMNTTEPPVDDVQMEVIEDGAGTGAGFLKILIPRSEKTPHRGMLADREYWKRNTEGFYRMEHFDLEDAFGRRPRPLLALLAELQTRRDEDPHDDLVLAVMNKGRGLGRYLAITCVFPGDVSIALGQPGWRNVTALNDGIPTATYVDNVSIFHPIETATQITSLIIKRPQKVSALELELRWVCDGMRERTAKGWLKPNRMIEIPMNQKL